MKLKGIFISIPTSLIILKEPLGLFKWTDFLLSWNDSFFSNNGKIGWGIKKLPRILRTNSTDKSVPEKIAPWIELIEKF